MILCAYLLGASALEVQSSDFSEIETVVIDVYCTGNNSNIMQCTTAESVYTCYSQDIAVRCQGNSAIHITAGLVLFTKM